MVRTAKKSTAQGPSPCTILLLLVLPALLLLFLSIEQISICVTRSWIWDILYRLPSQCAVYNGLSGIIILLTSLVITFAAFLLHRKPNPNSSNNIYSACNDQANFATGSDGSSSSSSNCFCCQLTIIQLVSLVILVAYILTAILSLVILTVVLVDQQAIATEDLATKFGRDSMGAFEELMYEGKRRLWNPNGIVTSFEGSPILQFGRYNDSLRYLQAVQFALGCCGMDQGVWDYVQGGRTLANQIVPISCCAPVSRRTLTSGQIDWTAMLSETCWANRTIYPDLGCRKRLLQVFFLPVDAGLSQLLAAHLLAILAVAIFIFVSGCFKEGKVGEEDEEEDKTFREIIPLQELGQGTKGQSATQVVNGGLNVSTVVEVVESDQVKPELDGVPELVLEPKLSDTVMQELLYSGVHFSSTNLDRIAEAPAEVKAAEVASMAEPSDKQPSTTEQKVPLPTSSHQTSPQKPDFQTNKEVEVGDSDDQVEGAKEPANNPDSLMEFLETEGAISGGVCHYEDSISISCCDSFTPPISTAEFIAEQVSADQNLPSQEQESAPKEVDPEVEKTYAEAAKSPNF